MERMKAVLLSTLISAGAVSCAPETQAQSQPPLKCPTTVSELVYQIGGDPDGWFPNYDNKLWNFWGTKFPQVFSSPHIGRLDVEGYGKITRATHFIVLEPRRVWYTCFDNVIPESPADGQSPTNPPQTN